MGFPDLKIHLSVTDAGRGQLGFQNMFGLKALSSLHDLYLLSSGQIIKG